MAPAIRIADGRHTVVERVLNGGSFVPNDAALDAQDAQIMLITGPNMAGKSTFIRQVAIIVLMAQVGSFVPATAATIGLVDRIFTRVGLARRPRLPGNQPLWWRWWKPLRSSTRPPGAPWSSSTKSDAAPSTYDGLSIARAVVEHLHNNPRLVSCKTLFATHYHELTELAATLPGVRNYRSSPCPRRRGGIAFLRRIVPAGPTAPMASTWRCWPVCRRRWSAAPRELLTVLEEERADSRGTNRRKRRNDTPSPQGWLCLRCSPPGDDRLTELLLEMDVANLTPLEAINKLYELQERARDGGK